MLRRVSLTVAAVVCLGLSATAKDSSWTCLPDGVKVTDVVSTRESRSADGHREYRKITVEQKLKELKARCSRGKLVDFLGTEIRFFKLAGCWGHPSPDDQEVLERQSLELTRLKKRYRVIEMTCNPSGEQIP